MRRLILAFVIAAAALLLAIGVFHVEAGRGTAQETTSESPKLFYVVESGRPLSLAVERDTTRVKLVCLQRLPLSASTDPEVQYDFGFDAVLLGPDGDEVWRGPVWFRSRRTVTVDETGEIRERTWLVARDAHLTDERVLEMDMAPLAGAGGELRLEAISDAVQPVFVRPYRRLPLQADTTYRLRAMEERRRQLMAQRIGSSTWHEIAPAEQARLASFRWVRMEARGARVRDYITRLVVLGDLRRTTDTDRARWHYLEPGRAVALNLQGPAEVELEAESIGAALEGIHVTLVRVSRRGDIDISPLPLGSSVGVSVPEGEVVTLSIVDEGPGPVRVSASSRAPGLFADTTASFEAETGVYRLGPDIRILRMHRLGAGDDPLEYELRPPDVRLDRVRVEARAASDQPARLGAELLDGDGRTLYSSSLSCPASLSHFEVAGTLEPGAMPTPANLPVRAELWVGDGAERLRLTADRPVDVTVSVPTGGGREPARAAAAYELETESVRLRYAPLEQRSWSPAIPMGVEQLARDGREVCVSAQVRLEPSDAALVAQLEVNPLDWNPPMSTRRQGVAWLPADDLPQQRMLEPWGGGSPSKWPDGARTRLVDGRETRVRFDEQGTAGLALWVDDPALLGSTAVVQADGRDLARVALLAEQMHVRIGPLEEGDHQLRLDAPGDGLLALIDRPPSGRGSAENYRARIVHRFDESLRVSLPVEMGADAVLYALPYYELDVQRPDRTAGYTVTFGDERPLCRPCERTTPLELSGSMEPMGDNGGFLADRRDRRLVPATPIRIAIGDDLEGGTVPIEIRRGPGPPMWIRLVAYGVRGRTPSRDGQWVTYEGHTRGSWAWDDPFQQAGTVAEILAGHDAPDTMPPTSEALGELRGLGWSLATAARQDAVGALPALAADAEGFGLEMVALRTADGDRVLLVNGPQSPLLLLVDGDRTALLTESHAVPWSEAVARGVLDALDSPEGGPP